MSVKPRLGFVGAGKVGTTLARLLYERGYMIAGVYSRNAKHAAELAQFVQSDVVASVRVLAASCDLIFLTVTDAAILEIVEQFGDIALKDKAVIHTSGVHEATLLQSLAARGAMIGSLHPVFPFASVEDAVSRLLGATFALQAEEPLLSDWLITIVAALDGRVLRIASGQKALYHSALVFASNYGVTLYAIALRLLVASGAQPEMAAQTLNTLLSGMVQNIATHGIPDALTGPLVRGDVSTIERHLDALGIKDVDLRELYVRLAEQTLPMIEARGGDTKAVDTILRRAMDDADKHT